MIFKGSSFGGTLGLREGGGGEEEILGSVSTSAFGIIFHE